MRSANVGRLATQPLTGTWFRALRLKHWKTRLSTEHTRVSTSRFSAASPLSPSYRVLYLGVNHQVALHEVRALLGHPASPVANPKGSWVIQALSLVLDHVVDLNDRSQQKRIATNHTELTGNWVNAPGLAPTQELGQALYNLPRVEGVLYPSSLVAESCLVVFPDKLGPRSSLRFLNEILGRMEIMS